MNKTTKIFTAISLLLISSVAKASEDGSSLETYNRAMFNFNTKLDDYVMKPVAKGYRAITTDFIRERVRNFFNNIKEPNSIINHSLQGNFSDSGISAGRFVINSTLGLLGTFDVATGWGLHNNETNFDKTLANWCVPDGPYIVLPLLGPSTPRATVGYMGDATTDPIYWISTSSALNKDWEKYSFYYGITALGFASIREENLEFLDNLTDNSVDPYATIKSTYMQNRLKMSACNQSRQTSDATVSYDFDFDEDE